MSFLVELHPDRYDPNAFARFNKASDDFDLDIARAMMWMSQLAYETHVPDTIKEVARIWKLTDARPFIQPARSMLPLSDTRGVIAHKDGATIVAFAGTDPLLLPNWISDFHVDLLHGDVHGGFKDAAAAVWDSVKDVLAPANSPVFITGHSLGAALAVLTADRAHSELNLANAQVYLYGCPRVGRREFADGYNATFGATTYRLVHGHDIVPTVPPPDFRHVGRFLFCASGDMFDDRKLARDSTSNEPLPTDEGPLGIVRQLKSLFLGPSPSSRRDVIGKLSEFLIAGIGDHLPDRYYSAFPRRIVQ